MRRFTEVIYPRIHLTSLQMSVGGTPEAEVYDGTFLTILQKLPVL